MCKCKRLSQKLMVGRWCRHRPSHAHRCIQTLQGLRTELAGTIHIYGVCTVVLVGAVHSSGGSRGCTQTLPEPYSYCGVRMAIELA